MFSQAKCEFKLIKYSSLSNPDTINYKKTKKQKKCYRFLYSRLSMEQLLEAQAIVKQKEKRKRNKEKKRQK